MPTETSERPALVLMDGTDSLQLTDGGKVYRPGDTLPHLSQARLVALQAAGIRIEHRHAEPVVTPAGEPSRRAAAEQIEGPAVIAAVEPVPAENTPSRRAAKKGND